MKRNRYEKLDYRGMKKRHSQERSSNLPNNEGESRRKRVYKAKYEVDFQENMLSEKL